MRNRTVSLILALVLVSVLAAPAGTVMARNNRQECEFFIGLVTDVGEIDDRSFNQSAWEGVIQAAEMLGISEDCYDYIETQDAADYGDNIAEFADAGANVIITVGFALGEATREAAMEYPEIHFIGVDQFQPDVIDNVTGLKFHEDRAGFLAGALAGMITNTGKVAAVLGTDLVPPVVAFGTGFQYGAAYILGINPEDVPITYHPGGLDVAFTDPEWGAQTAAQYIDQGYDVIFGAGGKTGNGALQEVANRTTEDTPLYCIGVDTDQWLTVPEAHPCLVSSAMKMITDGIVDLVSQVYNGTVQGGNYYGPVGLAPFHDFDYLVTDEMMAQLQEIEARLDNGTLYTGWPPAEETDLGTAENPIVWGFVPSEQSEEIVAGAEQVAQLINEMTGLVVEPRVATEYAGVIEGMCNGEVHLGALNTFGYVLAHERGCAEVAVVSVRYGSTYYQGQIITRADSGIESIEDLAGHTFCRPDPLSTSGWIIPSITMRAHGIDPDTDLAEVVDAGGHDAVAAAVYNGDCDAGATYVDARGRVEDEYPDIRDVVVVIAESAPIPNDTNSFAPDVPVPIRQAIVDALLEIASNPETSEVLQSVYQWEGLVIATDAFFDDFRQQLEAAGIDIEELQ